VPGAIVDMLGQQARRQAARGHELDDRIEAGFVLSHDRPRTR
jgi:hypothetical protein